jgi:hypothetical protein
MTSLTVEEMEAAVDRAMNGRDGNTIIIQIS